MPKLGDEKVIKGEDGVAVTMVFVEWPDGGGQGWEEKPNKATGTPAPDIAESPDGVNDIDWDVKWGPAPFGGSKGKEPPLAASGDSDQAAKKPAEEDRPGGAMDDRGRGDLADSWKQSLDNDTAIIALLSQIESHLGDMQSNGIRITG